MPSAGSSAGTHVAFLSGVDRDGKPLQPRLKTKAAASNRRAPRAPASERAPTDAMTAAGRADAVAGRNNAADVPASPWSAAPAAPAAPRHLARPRQTEISDPVHGIIHEKAATWVAVLGAGLLEDARRQLEGLVMYASHIAGLDPCAALRRCRVENKTLVQQALQHRDWQGLRYLIEHKAHEPSCVARRDGSVALGAWGDDVDTSVAWICGPGGHTQYVGGVTDTRLLDNPQALPVPHGFGYAYAESEPHRRDYAMVGQWSYGRLEAGQVTLLAGATRFEGCVDHDLRFDGMGLWRNYRGEEVLAQWNHGTLLSDGLMAMRDGRVIEPDALHASIPFSLETFLET